MLPTDQAVRSFMLDIQRATWELPQEKGLPTVTIRGCVFHWVKAVWRKCQQLRGNRLFVFISIQLKGNIFKHSFVYV